MTSSTVTETSKIDTPADQFFISRIQLLIIMTKAYLKGFPLGEFRRKAILKNAEEVFYMSLVSAEPEAEIKNGAHSGEGMTDDHLFQQRVQLLAVMAKAIAEDRFSGSYKHQALEDNLNYVCDRITFTGQVNQINFLKVA
jgi:hypothetical protein